MQCFWFVPTGDLWRVDYQHLEDQPASAIPNGTPEVTAMDGNQHPNLAQAVKLQQKCRQLHSTPALLRDKSVLSDL